MARKKISEFRAKTILYKELGIDYAGVSIDAKNKDWEAACDGLSEKQSYVVKVDQGVKGRKKKGLVLLDRKKTEIVQDIKSLSLKGYNCFLIEEFLPHSDGESYFAIERTGSGNIVSYSPEGGIDIEQNADSVNKITQEEALLELPKKLSIKKEYLEKILKVFDECYCSFLEINPLVVIKNTPYLLDAAVLVDSAGEFFAQGAWSNNDIREYTGHEKSEEEIALQELSQNSQASFSFTILNKDGSVWTLLSGGGASIVVADEVTNLGMGKSLANYGEYSGNPNAEETYIYTKNVLSLMLRSNAPKKVLIIGGGVANFTDIRHTFKGVIQALEEFAEELQKNNVKVFVRRGGPHQEAGLSMMKKFLTDNKLLGEVTDQSMVLTDIVSLALKTIR